MVKDAFSSFEQLYTDDVAVLESAYGKMQSDNQALKKETGELPELVNKMRKAHNELEGNQEMLSDQIDGLHYGVVMFGG